MAGLTSPFKLEGSAMLTTSTTSASAALPGSGGTAIVSNQSTGNLYITFGTINGGVPGNSATFTPTFTVTGATLVAPGTGYAASDVLTLADGNGATLTVSTVTGGPPGPVATFTVSAAGSGVTTLLTNPVAVTGGTGTGATFNVTYTLASIASSGGTGYNVGNTLNFDGMVATTLPTAHISVATSHAATTTVVDTGGTAISVKGTISTNNTITAATNTGYCVPANTSRVIQCGTLSTHVAAVLDAGTGKAYVERGD